MQSPHEICLFVQHIINVPSDPESFSIPIEISKELLDNEKEFREAFKDFRSHILDIYKDRIVVISVFDVSKVVEEKDRIFRINDDIAKNVRPCGEFFGCLRYDSDSERLYWTNKRLTYRMLLKNGKYHGISKRWFSNGKLSLKERYVDGKLEGERKAFRPNGNVDSIERRKNNILDGPVEFYDEIGKLKCTRLFKNGE